jgi:hypothetical protein
MKPNATIEDAIMPVTLYSFKLKRELPLLSDEEYHPIEHALSNRIKGIKEYRQRHGVSLAEAKRHSSDDALDYYERLTGVRLSDADELYWVQLSRYGRICPQCGKPFRTPEAKLCAECGLELPRGEIAGPLVFLDV